MKSFFILCLMMVFSFSGWDNNQLQGLEEVISANLDNAQKPPLKKFRTTDKKVFSDSIKLDGLSDLSLSASSQFSEEELSKIINLLPSSYSIIVVDLREESHGFINGFPVSWVKGEHGEYNDANVGKSLAEIEHDEKQRLAQASQEGSIQVITKKNHSFQQLTVEAVLTEKELIESKGLTYIRLPVTDHHHPSDAIVDEFIQLVLSLPDSAWLHFHCRGGCGRTTTFLSMYDMMFNGDKVSVEDILNRQKLIGGKDLINLDPTSYKYQPGIERLEFLRNFYKYCNQVPDFSISWSQWIVSQQVR